MIKIYDSADYNFRVCLANIMPTKAVVVKNTDDYYADLEIPHKYTTDNGRTEIYTPILKANNIATIKTPWGEQPFYLDAPEITPNGFKFKAQHISRILKRYAIPEFAYFYRPMLDDVAYQILSRSGANVLFTVDVQVDPYVYYPEPLFFYLGWHNGTFVGNGLIETEVETTNAYDAYKFISKVYGVKLDFDGRKVILKEYPNAMSTDVILRNAKNIDDIKVTENWSNVCTRCVAIGYRDLRAVYTAPSNPYAYNFDRVVEFEASPGVDVNDDDAVIGDLLYQAQRYVQAHINPEVNYTVKATPDVDVDIDDPVIIKYAGFINLTAKIISIKYNALTEKYEEVEFGNTKSSIKGFKTKVEKQIKSLKVQIGQGGL